MKAIFACSRLSKSVSKVLFKPVLRNYTTKSSELKNLVYQQITAKAKQVAELRKKHGNLVLSECTIETAYAGMRSLKALVTETSLLDANEGIRFRGYTIPECQKLLPKASNGNQPLPEAMLWLLLTGQIPTSEQVTKLTQDLHERSEIPENVFQLLKSLDKSVHPMTQLSMGILALQPQSIFAKRYQEGIGKNDLWDPCFEDALNLIAKIPRIAALIYRKTFRDEPYIIEPDTSLDWGANFAKMMGVDNSSVKNEIYDMFRLYLVLHSDHEGGNASAHTTHLVGSTLADPYLSLSAGMNALAGPLHGLANQESLKFIRSMKEQLKGEKPTKENLSKLVWNILNSGRVVPGYGHAVLRKTDPRYTAQREFALKHFPNDELFQLLDTLYQIVPTILTEHGKTKNPYPNVDAHSGVLLTHYGITEEDYYTVMFGVSRSLGVLSSLVWDRGLKLPIERPKSMTTDALMKIAEEAEKKRQA